MYLGDNLIAGGITALVDEFRTLGCNSEILLAEVPNPEQFGVAELTPRARSAGWWRSPRSRRATWPWSASTCSTPTIFESVKRIKPSPRGELEITDAIQDLIDRGLDVHPHIVRGWWKDTGKLDDMLEANRIVLEGLEAPRGASARAIGEGSRIEGRVQLGEGVELDRLAGARAGGHRRRRPAGERLRRALHLDRRALHAGLLRDGELDRPRRLARSATSRCASTAR